MPPPETSLSLRAAGVVRRGRRAILARRRMLAALLAALAVLTGVRAATAPPEPTARVLVARTDLPGGAALRAGDVHSVPLPVDVVPSGSMTDPQQVVGRVLAAPLRRHEPVTDVRLVAPAMLAGYPGRVAAPVRVADAATVALLEVGDRVDLVAAAPEGGDASVVVPRAPVVAVPAPAPRDAGLVPGGLLVVAVTEEEAIRLATASVRYVLSVLLTR
jgi:Flp pilus assembly protein CpaB